MVLSELVKDLLANFLAYHILANGGPAPEIRGFVPETHNALWMLRVTSYETISIL